VPHREGCTPKTRVELLAQLGGWAGDDLSEKIYWLNGMAGTGKTTIAYSLSEMLDKDSKLAACFFCSRQLPACSNISYILPTISYQLARFCLPFKFALSSTLENNADVHTRKISEQFEKLIVEPLQKMGSALPANLVVVIDALDECDDGEGIDELLSLLLSHAPKLPLKFFVTSRPRLEIQEQMRNPQEGCTRLELRLHELEHSTVQQDIKTYLELKLKPMNLPTAHLERLSAQSGVLFIYAATVVRYIGARKFTWSAERLKHVLSTSTSSPNDSGGGIDALYTTILEGAFDDVDLDGFNRLMMGRVLNTVICAREPLTVDAIAKILETESETSVQGAINSLLSVVNVSGTNGPVTTLHESFPDFMLNESRSGKFYCDSKKQNALLARQCFRVMEMSKQFNICELETSYVFDSDVLDLEERAGRSISKALHYACQYWGVHLELVEPKPTLVDDLQKFLSLRLLLWMEILNLKKCIAAGAGLLSRVQTWCQVSYWYLAWLQISYK
jgi:hypothetical protein